MILGPASAITTKSSAARSRKKVSTLKGACVAGAIIEYGGTPTGRLPRHPLKAFIMKHEVITLGETHHDYPSVYQSDPYRIIVCKDALQYIIQKRKGSQWHNKNYYTHWDVMVRHHPELSLPATSPSLLKREQRHRGAVGGMKQPLVT